MLISDWIAVNVLRSVALSTNSVAASVEPVMQQQFFTLSPMAGQETFNTMEIRPPPNAMAHTPTTSSMLAALQNDPFPGAPLDGSSSGFNSDAYSSLSYMDTTSSQDVQFPDYGPSSSFDVTGFTPQDLGMNSAPTPAASEPEQQQESEPVKSEGQT